MKSGNARADSENDKSLFWGKSIDKELDMPLAFYLHLKRTVPRSTNAQRTRQENTPRVRRAFVKINKRAANAGSNLLKLLSALSAIAAPGTGTLQNLCTFLVRMPALGAALGGERSEQSLIGYPERRERR